MTFSIIVASGFLFGEWAGKAAYVLTEALLLLLAIIYVKLRRLDLRDVMRWYPVPIRFWGSGIVMALGSAVLLDELDRLVSLIITIQPEQLEQIRDTYTSSNSWDFIWIILGVGIAAPIVEESLFRGFIQRVFESRWDITRAILLTAFLFAVIHMRPYWVIQLLIMAVWMGYLSWKWDSIIPAVLIHAANNLWSVGQLYWLDHPSYEFYEWKGHVNPIWIMIAGFIVWKGFIANSKIWKDHRDKLEIENE